MIKYLILFSLIGNIALAEDAVYLDKDKPAPYAGYLLPQDKLVQLRNNTFERDTLKFQNESLNTSLKLQDDIIAHKDQQMTLYSNQMDSLAKTAYSASNMNTWERIGWIALGIGITGLSIYGVHALYH